MRKADQMTIFTRAILAIIWATFPALAQDNVDSFNSQVGAWMLSCDAEEDAPERRCLMAATAVNPLAQRELALIQITRVLPDEQQGDETYAARLTSPTNVNVRAGIDLQVDQTWSTNIGYEVCTVNNCITSFALTQEMIAEMRDGFAASLTFMDATGNLVSGAVSLDGFGRSLDSL